MGQRPTRVGSVVTGTGRVSLVTGGARGIGRAIVADLAARGDRVAATYRGERPADADDGVLWVRCDVTDPDAVDAAFREVEEMFGPVEVLVSNAGITRDLLVLRMGADDWQSVIDANLTGGFTVAKRAVPKMLRARFGRILFVSSVVAATGQAGQANYAASKAGLNGLTQTIAKEYGKKGITANAVAAGFFETDMTRDSLPQHMRDFWKSYCPVPKGRIGELSELSAVINFLASKQAAFINGQIINVTGGLDWGP
ncbi:MAG: SDR family oxidoreductase [Acidimicrobiales bacterium]|nr:SDR family oxidoreductase [Acidimicrobiales bacterium]